MFADYTDELPESWDTEEVQNWKNSAKVTQKNFYLNFAGCQWSEFDLPKSKKLLRSKICYALFGPPAENADNLEDLYKPDEQKKAEEIIAKILTLVQSDVEKIKVGFLFILCKKKEEEFPLPLFRVFKKKNGKKELSGYVDTQCRTYSSWNDWKSQNNLPMMKYCYPKNGYYTCSDDGLYEFDEKRDPVLEFGTSPSCNVSSRVLRQTDTATSIISIGSAIVGAVALFTPVAPAVILGSVIIGASSATYGAARVVTRLVDKGQHGESLGDLESTVLWVSLAATPLNFATSAMNGFVRGAAVNGRILSSSVRTFVTILNFTTLGVDSVMMGFGLFNLIEKARKNQLGPLDVVQFSMSVFFFTNTLIQPKVAGKIIAQAQEQHISNQLNSVTDKQAKLTLEKFVKDNRGDNGIKDTSKIIRTINRIDDPNNFFKNVADAQKIEIGGRQGRTVLVTDANGHTNRINPNRTMYYSNAKGYTNFGKTHKGLSECFDKNLEDVKLNGRKIYGRMNNKQRAALKQAYENTAQENKDVILTAHEIAETLDCKTPEQVASVIEIVASEVKGLDGDAQLAKLNEIRGTGKNRFVHGIKSDQAKAQEISRQNDLCFSDDLKAVYHYRKHGAEFPTQSVNKIECYLDSVPDKLLKDANLTEILQLPDGKVRKFYRTKNDYLGIVTEAPGQRTISTMFKKHGTYNEFMRNLEKHYQYIENPTARIIELGERFALKHDYLATHIYLGIQTREPKLLEKCSDVNHYELQEIARQLYAISECSENSSRVSSRPRKRVVGFIGKS